MRNSMKPVAAGVILAMTAMTGVAQAEVTANIGATSNYIWRGVTQTDFGPAVQGGLDYSHDSGFYAGLWSSNVDFGDTGFEMDLYGGFAGDINKFKYDVGYIYYLYPIHTDLGFSEVYGKFGYGPVSAGIYYNVTKEDGSTGDFYIPASFDWTFENVGKLGAIDFSVYGGYYDFDDDALEDYAHWGVGVSKPTEKFGAFHINYDQNDLDDGRLSSPQVSVSWTMDFGIL